MSKVISVRLSDEEELRLRGAAAVADMPLSACLKWLMSQGRAQSDTELILRRLDSLGVAIANVSGSAPRDPVLNVGLPARDTFITRLRERGIPLSTPV